MDSDTNIRMMKDKINSTYELSKSVLYYREINTKERKQFIKIEIHSISEV